MFTMAAIAFVYARTTASLIAMAVIVLLTTGGLLVEWLVVTPSEAVQASLRELLVCIEADDLPGVLALISQADTQMRSDAETLMPMFDVRKARSTGEVQVAFDDSKSKPKAVATFRFIADVLHKKTGIRAPYSDPGVTIFFVQEGDRWVVSGYETERDWRKEAGRL